MGFLLCRLLLMERGTHAFASSRHIAALRFAAAHVALGKARLGRARDVSNVRPLP
jgi:hypothetical protein